MTDIVTSRLILHPVDVAEAQRIRDRTPAPPDLWADDYPFDGDVVAVRNFLAATLSAGEQRPFGYFRIARRADGRAIGGIGFEGRPDSDGAVEVGYGLAASGRGHGYAAEALGALSEVAFRHGAIRLRADTLPGNAASIRTLEHAGFVRAAGGGDPLQFELRAG